MSYELESYLIDYLAQGKPAVMATMLSLAGSAPRTPGTKMLILEDGTIKGTIGGGILEAEVMRRAKEMMGDQIAQIVHFDLTSKDVGNMDMICGGVLDILLEPISPTSEAEEFNAAIIDLMKSGKKSVSIAALEMIDEQADKGRKYGLKEGKVKVKRALFSSSGKITGDPSLPEEHLRQIFKDTVNEKAPTIVYIEDKLYVAEPMWSGGTLLIFGAGHVSQKLGVLACQVGFRVIILDDRQEFANEKRFPEADKIIIPASMDDALGELEIGPDSYIVIVTRGHRYDMTILDQVLHAQGSPKYIGMIGSIHKRDAIYAQLLKNGHSKEELARVHCPIGLNIGAETPEEIAICIIAEVIACRSGISD